MYDSDYLDQVNDSVSILDYATACGFVFQQRGKRNWTNCPLHEDKTPSLMVDDQNRFHCFSCGIHGGIINWISSIENIPFMDAVDKASRIGHIDPSKMCRSETLLFNRRIYRKKNIHEEPHIILPESRWEAFPSCHPQIWIDEGISETVMDYFDIRMDNASSRIVYPVRLDGGELIGIKGRTTVDYKALDVPKYMNYYPITTVDFLQSLDKTLPFVKKSGEVILFEGIKSCMKAATWGIWNTAAVESHVINRHQVRLLVRLGVNITVAFDSDVSYSSEETLRSSLDTLKRFTNVYVVEDPDGILGGAKAKNAPVDLGKDIWVKLYKERRRWT